MLTKNFFLAITIVTAGLFMGCAPQDKRTAEEKVEDAKEDLKEAKGDVREQRKAERSDYWEDRERFKGEYELRIKENNDRIAEIRIKHKGDPDFEVKKQRIDELEQENKELKRRLDEYDDNQKAERWDDFKREFNNDMDKLGESIKGVFKDDVK